MILNIDGEPRNFTPIREFRARFCLPPEFGLMLFAPKDYTNLGTIENAAQELAFLRERILESIPSTTPKEGWMAFILHLQRLFRQELTGINSAVGLRPSEVDFAAGGFGEVCQAYLHETMRARLSGEAPLSFQEVYGRWLNSTIMISRGSYSYQHKGETWRIRLVRHVYGRTGLIVRTKQDVHYISDSSISCPAETFMRSLLHQVADRIHAIHTNQ